MTGQHFSLRWNNHQSHVLSAFDALLQNESLVDCTLVCEDSNVKAHKVVLSACSPYFQKIFTDNPCKHPIIVLKDVRGWEVQCIVDFMYKGETSVPEAQLPSLLQAAESLRVRGLTSSEQQTLPPGLILEAANGSAAVNGGAGYNGMPSRRYSPYDLDGPTQPKLPRPPPSHSSQSSPMSLTHHALHDADAAGRPRSPAGPPGSGPRRKQARPRRRSGDSVGNSSLDLSKADSPPSSHGGFRNKSSPNHLDVENTPENLSIKRPASSSPAINLVKTESLLEDHARPTSTSDCSGDLHRRPKVSPAGSMPSLHSPRSLAENHFSEMAAKSAHFAAAARAAAAAGMRHGAGEHEARVEALQALNFMAAGGGLPPFPHPGLSMPPHSAASQHHQASSMAAAAAAAAAHRDRSASTPGTPNSYADNSALKAGFEFQRISIDRTKMSEEEAFEHAIEMIQTRQMGFRKAADFFSVSKWKLYKTARKRGIYAEIKKQNQAQALTKVPTNVQHFADMGVYKQLKKKTHLAKDALFPHLPTAADEVRKVYKTANNNNNYPSMVDLHKKMFSKGADDLIQDEDEREKPEMVVRPVIPEVLDDEDDDEEEEEERVLVINHRETDASPDDDEDSGRDDSA